MTPEASHLVGATIDGRYLVQEHVAAGGMAYVYKAVDTRLDRVVALKVMRSEYADDANFVERFRDEARAAAKLTHQNVVSVYDQGSDGNIVFLAMEFVPGQTLRKILATQGATSPEQACSVVGPVLAGIAAAHAAGFVHRDIKPENILVGPEGQIKVTDFGLVRAQESPNSKTQGMLIGTAAYLTPEHVQTGHSDPRSDIYQVGILLYEMLTGSVPHTGDTAWNVAYQHVQQDIPPVRTLAPACPAELADLVVEMTRRDPSERMASVSQARERIHEIALTLPPAANFGVTEHDTVQLDRAAEPTTVETATNDALPATVVPADAVIEEPESVGDNQVPDPELDATAVQPDPDEPTPSPAILPSDAFPAESAEPPSDQAPRRKRRVLLPMAVAACLGLIAWGFWYAPFDRSAVPDVIGLSEAKAMRTLTGAGFAAEVADRDFSEEVPANQVITANPDPGETARNGSMVQVVISKGPERYQVPKLKGMSPAQAEDKLTSTNLAVGDSSQKYSDNVSRGDIVKTKPKKGATVRRDTKINLILSKGPAPVDVPNVVGMTRTAAQESLKAVGLVAKIGRSEYSKDIPRGSVIATTPTAGTTTRRTEEVELELSKGPPPVEVPRVVDMPRNQAVARLEGLGFAVRISEGIVTPLDRVYSQDPPPGEEVPYGSTITLSIF